MNFFLIKYQKPAIIGLIAVYVISSILTHPFNYLQSHKSMVIFSTADVAYENYVYENGWAPSNLDFLPADIREKIMQANYPLKLDGEQRLKCYFPVLPIFEMNLYKYFINRKDTSGYMIIGKIHPRK